MVFFFWLSVSNRVHGFVQNGDMAYTVFSDPRSEKVVCILSFVLNEDLKWKVLSYAG